MRGVTAPGMNPLLIYIPFLTVSSMIFGGGGGWFAASFFMILSKLVAPWGVLYSDDLLP